MKKFYGRYHELVVGFDVSISRLVLDLLPDWFLHSILHGNNMMGVACGAGNAYPSGAPDFTPVFDRAHVVSFPMYVFVFSILSCCPDSQVLLKGLFVIWNSSNCDKYFFEMSI